MGRSVMGLCVMAGSTVGGFLPELWGASGLSMQAIAFGIAGAVAGVWAGSRLNDQL
jgi:outer membrane lipoprotein SlyB